MGCPAASHYGADATVFVFGSAAAVRRTRLLAVVVGVGREVRVLAVVAVLRVRGGVRGVGRVLVVLRVRRRVVVVVVVVRRRVLWGRAVLGVMGVVRGRRHVLCCLRRVVQVGRVGLVRYEGGVARWHQRGLALRRRLPSLAAKERPEDGRGRRVGERGVAAGGALSWRGGSPSRVRTANDGPLQEGKEESSDTELLRNIQQTNSSLPNSDKEVAKCYTACK